MFLGADTVKTMTADCLEWTCCMKQVITMNLGTLKRYPYSLLAVQAKMTFWGAKILDKYKYSAILPHSAVCKMMTGAVFSLATYVVCLHYKQRPSEYFADNFANKYASQKALQGGYDTFIKNKNEERLFYNQQCMQYITHTAKKRNKD